MKFIAPNIDDIPAKWRLKIAKSTDPPECDCVPDNGGYQNQKDNKVKPLIAATVFF